MYTMTLPTTFTALLATVLLAPSSSYAQISLSPATTAPQGASATVNPSFCAYAFEERSFYYFANYTLSQNLISQVSQRTNSHPVIRVGGNSLNLATWSPSTSTSIVVPPHEQNKSIPGSLTLGPGYFDAFKSYAGAQYIVDLPMNNKATDVDTSVAIAQQAWDIIGSENIMMLELGNEPNSYNGGYDASQYATQFESYSTAVAQGLNLSTEEPQFLVGSLANLPSGDWNASNMFSDGLSSVSQRIKAFSVHYYQQSTHTQINLENNLMSHTRITTRLEAYTPMITYLSTLTPPIPFSFGEVGCGPGGIANNGSFPERSFGAALWQVDFMLYTMTLNVSRVHIQSGYGFDFSLWQPNEFDYTPAAVYANYYAHLYVADFISTSGAMQAIELPVSPTSDTLTAYAAYEHGALQRVALVNMDYFDGTSTSSSDRPTQTFTLAVPSSVHSVTVRTLTGGDAGALAYDTSNITWGGESFSLAEDGMGQMIGQANSTVQAQNGAVSIVVPASEAVMVYFGAVNSTADGNATSTATSTTAGPTANGNNGPTSTSSSTPTSTHKGAASGVRVESQALILTLTICVIALGVLV